MDRLLELPEASLFPTDAAAREAINEISSDANRSAGTWLVAILLGAVSLGGFYGLHALLSRLTSLHHETIGWISLGIVLLGAIAFTVWSVRDTYPRELRKKLVARGIAVCLGCGYDLRSLPDASRCPECGARRADSAG